MREKAIIVTSKGNHIERVQMRESTPAAMPRCFETWCAKFDDLLRTGAQRQGFRHYLGGLLGESQRKNLTQIANNSVGVVYSRLHHFVTEATWSETAINERRLKIMNKCYQTRISKGFTLIVDDTGQRKSGNLTEGIGRQYIGEIGKTDNGVVAVTTHLYDGKKSVPLDIEIYRHASSLPKGKEDEKFKKKPEIAVELIQKSLNRGYYFITNVEPSIATAEWFVNSYTQRNWVEVFYRDAKGWLGLREYQVRDSRSMMRNFILVYCAYTFIIWHKLTGGFQRRWATKPLKSFADALEAFRTAMSFRFFSWLTDNVDIFTAHKASLGYIWA